jgi:Fic family protein
MILNNYLTMQEIGRLKHEPLTRELVLNIHQLVTDQTLDNPSAAGRFRTGAEKIWVGDDLDTVFHDPPLASELEARMERMCDFANGKTPSGFMHPVLRSIILHFWLAYDHPYVDGNGRTERALFYWSMLNHGFWLAEFISISHILLKAPVKYGMAFLLTETDDNDLTYFILHHLGVICEAIQGLHDYIGRKTSQLQETLQTMRGMDILNHRQRALVAHALKHPNTHYTIEGHRTSQAVVYQTARMDLLDLVKRGLLTTKKQGKAFIFLATPNLEKKMAQLSKRLR